MRSLKTNRVVAGIVFTMLTAVAVTGVLVQISGNSALAQQAGGTEQPASAAPTAPKGAYDLLTPQNSTLLLVDHQPQMAFGVQSHDRGLILNNTVGLAKAAKAFKVPTILTTVAAETFSGPLFPDIQAVFPEQKPIDRTTMNAWEDERVRNAVGQAERPKLIIAGLWTEVCVVLPMIDAKEAGYEVYVVADASGGTSQEAHELAMARMIQAGAIPVTWQQVMLEWQRDWARQETYAAVNDIVRQHSGAYGMGINYARTMLGSGGEGQTTQADQGTAFGKRVKIPKPSQ
jgi:nicotinamidase-related amidase